MIVTKKPATNPENFMPRQHWLVVCRLPKDDIDKLLIKQTIYCF